MITTTIATTSDQESREDLSRRLSDVNKRSSGGSGR